MRFFRAVRVPKKRKQNEDDEDEDEDAEEEVYDLPSCHDQEELHRGRKRLRTADEGWSSVPDIPLRRGCSLIYPSIDYKDWPDHRVHKSKS